jgi:hypothetical protein
VSQLPLRSAAAFLGSATDSRDLHLLTYLVAQAFLLPLRLRGETDVNPRPAVHLSPYEA